MNNFWNDLNKEMSEQKFLTPLNAVVQNLKNSTVNLEQGLEALRQYYYLVVAIVQYLTIAMVRIPVPEAKVELRRNLGEELGSRTNGIPHQELLEALLKSELGLEVRSAWSNATKEFITKLQIQFHTASPHFIAGMIYALEATASPELVVVAEIINLATGKEVVNLEKLQEASSTSSESTKVTTIADFISFHVHDYEVGHESGLRDTLSNFVEANREEFAAGFSFVLSAMKDWWLGLAKA